MARLLFVEDDDLIRSLWVEALTDAGHNVVEAENAEVAAHLLGDRTHFDALLTDVKMPGAMDGVALGQLFRQSHPDRPIVYASGAPEALPGSCHSSAKDMVLEKPCSLSKLVSCVNALT